MSRLRQVFDGTRPFSALGIGFCLLGLVMFVAILLSPNGWAWWVDTHSVQGHEQDGLVYYSVRGVNYTVNDPSAFAGSRPSHRTVYYLASDPADSSLHNLGNEVFDWGLTAGPGLVGIALLATAFVNRSRRRSALQHTDRGDSYGYGIPSATIRALTPKSGRNT